MADPLYGLPTLEDLQAPPGPLPVLRRRPVAEPVAEEPLTPNQQKQLELIQKPRSALGEIGAGAARGFAYELPKMIGQGLKATGKQGGLAFDAGQKLIDAVEPNNTRFLEDRNPDAHNAVTGAFASGASMLAPSLAPLALLPLAPAVGLAAGGAGALAATGAAGAALFGSAQYQDTYEAAKKKGLSDEDAHAAGLKTGLIEGAGEAVAGPVLGKFLGAGRRLLTKKMDLPTALSAIQNPTFWKDFAKMTGKTAATETATEMGQSFGEALVEKNAGISDEDPYHAAVSAIGPTLAMTAMLGLPAGHGLRRALRDNQNAYAAATQPNPNATAESQLRTVNEGAAHIVQQLKPIVGDDAAMKWRLDQLEASNARMAGAEEDQDNVNLREMTAAKTAQAARQAEAQAETDRLMTEQGLGQAIGKQTHPRTRDDRLGGIGTDTGDPLLDALDRRQGAIDTQQANIDQNERDYNAAAEQAAAAKRDEYVAGLQQQADDIASRTYQDVIRAQQEQFGEEHVAAIREKAQAEIDQIEQQIAQSRAAGREMEQQADVPRHPAEIAREEQDIAATQTAERVRQQSEDELFAHRMRGEAGLDEVDRYSTEQAGNAREAALANVAPAAQPTAVQLAFEKAQRDVEKAKGQAETRKAIDARNAAAAAVKAEEESRPGPRDQQQAAEHVRLIEDWRTTAAAAGMTVRGEVGAKVKKALFEASKLGTESAPQLEKLKEAAATLKGSARKSLDAYIAKVEAKYAVLHPRDRRNVGGQAAPAQDTRTEPQHAANEVAPNNTAVPQGANEGVATPEPIVKEGAGAEVVKNDLPVNRPKAPRRTEATVKAARAAAKGVAATAKAAVEKVAKVVTRRTEATVKAARKAAKEAVAKEKEDADKAAAEAAAAKKAKTATQKKRGPRKVAAQDVAVADTAPGADAPIVTKNGWVVPDKGKPWVDSPLTDETREVPKKAQRDVDPSSLYEFEFFEYDADPRKSVTARNNRPWLESYREAQNDARGEGAGVANAQAALDWLEQYHGPDIHDRAGPLVHRLMRADKVSARMSGTARAHEEAVHKAERYQYAKALRAAHPNLSEERVKEETDKYFDTNKHEGALSAGYDKPLHDVLNKTTKLADVLDHIAENGSTDGARTLAKFLKALNMRTSIRYTNKFSLKELGAYSHHHNAILINKGGITEHTVLHEAVHAATVGQLRKAMAALQVPPGRRSLEQHALVQDLGELRRLMAELKTKDGYGQYAFKNEFEFVSESLSNAAFKAWLETGKRPHSGSWLNRFGQWLAEFLGIHKATDTQLKNALADATQLSYGFATGSRAESGRNGLNDLKNPPDKFGMATGFGNLSPVQAAIKQWDSMAENHNLLGNIPDKVRNAVLKLSSGHALGRRFEKSPHAPLRAFGKKLRKIEEVNDQRARIMQEMGSASFAISRQVELALRALPTRAARKAMRKNLGKVGGEMSRLNIDLNKDFDGNMQAGAELDNTPKMREHVNNLHALYRSLPNEFKAPLNASFAMNRKMYIQQAATTLAGYLDSRKDPQFEPMIKSLDILDPALHANNTPKAAPADSLPYYLDTYTEELDKRIQKVFEEIRVNPDMTDNVITGIETYYKGAVKNPYQYLGRNGENFVEFDIADNPEALAQVQAIVDKYGMVVGEPTKDNRHVFIRMENSAQMKAMRKEMDALAANGSIDKLGSGNLPHAGITENNKGVDQFVHQFNAMMQKRYGAGDGATPEEIKAKTEVAAFARRMALDLTQDSSARKSLVRRKDGGILGYEGDWLRHFDHRAANATSMLASTYAGPRYSDVFADLQRDVQKMSAGTDPTVQKAAQAGLASARNRYANTLNPIDAPAVDAIKALGHGFFLGMSPAYYLTNATQPWHLTLPVLGARYGMIKSFNAMKDATAKGLRVLYATNKAGATEGNQLGGIAGAIFGVLDAPLVLEQAGMRPDEIDFLKQTVRSGKMNETQGHEQGRLAEGGSPGLAATMKVVSMGAHQGEVLNRITAGLAAYNLEMKRSNGNVEKATKAGLETIEDTQYNYSDRDTAPFLGRHGFAGKVTPLFTQFMTYSFKTMELLYRLARDSTRGVPADLPPEQHAQWREDQKVARKSLAGVMFTTSMLAGTLGLPFATVITRMMDAVAGDDDDPADVKVAYRRFLADMFGKDVGEFIAHGAPQALLGAATTARMGLADLMPGSRFLADRRELKDRIKDGALNMAGPGVAAGTDILTGLDHMADGRVADGLMEALPLSLRNIGKAIKMANVGYTNSTGNLLPMPVTPGAVLTQAIGFTPGVKAEQSEGNFAFKTRDTLLKQERGQLANKVYLEIERNGEISPGRLAELQAWNQKNPTYKIDLRQALQARAKARGVAEVSGTDIAAATRFLPELKRYDYLNTR